MGAFKKPLSASAKAEISLAGDEAAAEDGARAKPARGSRKACSAAGGTSTPAAAGAEAGQPKAVQQRRPTKSTAAAASAAAPPEAPAAPSRKRARQADVPAANAEEEGKPGTRRKKGQAAAEPAALPPAGDGEQAAPAKRGGRKKKQDEGGTGSAEAPSKAEEAPVAKRTRQPKPEGPYTKFKEAGAIPEPALVRAAADAAPGRQRLTAVAWNVAGLRAFLKSRVADLQKVASEEKPDIIGLLETKLQEGGTEESVALLHEALPDYEVAAVHCATAKKGYSSTAVLMRKGTLKPTKIEASDLPSAPGEGRIITVDFEAIAVVVCYVPNSGQDLARLGDRIDGWDVQLRERLSKIAEEKAVVLLGDLNVAHLDEDIWNVEAPHVPKGAGTTPQERASFAKLLATGFVDGFRHLHPQALGAFTYWSVRAGNRQPNRGLRLDYAVVSKGMVEPDALVEARAPALLDVFHMPAVCPGDHCPVGVVVAL